jgi:hypothetical protein
MARAVSRDRLLAAREILSRLRHDPSFRETVVADAKGERQILIASIDDPMGELLKRVQSTGLPVTLCVRGGSASRSMTVATMRPVEPDDHPVDSTPIDPGANVGMFICYLWEKRSVVFHLEEYKAQPADFELELA